MSCSWQCPFWLVYAPVDLTSPSKVDAVPLVGKTRKLERAARHSSSAARAGVHHPFAPGTLWFITHWKAPETSSLKKHRRGCRGPLVKDDRVPLKRTIIYYQLEGSVPFSP